MSKKPTWICRNCKRIFNNMHALGAHRPYCQEEVPKAKEIEDGVILEPCTCKDGPCNRHEADAW